MYSRAPRADEDEVNHASLMRWRRVALGLLATAASVIAPVVADSAPASMLVPFGVQDYAVLLARTLHTRRTAPIESLYAIGMQAADSLLTGVRQLESLDDSTFAEVQRRMQGFTVWRDEVVLAAPDASFFLDLARAHGDAADTAFFHALSLTYGQGVWPVYIEQQTDISGCTRFGSGHLVATFAIWNEFASSHPWRYGSWSAEELRKTEEQLTSGSCACGGRESVIRELRSFVHRFPSASVAPRLRARLRAVDSGTSGIHYNCVAR
jgi:hypothetical protein